MRIEIFTSSAIASSERGLCSEQIQDSLQADIAFALDGMRGGWLLTSGPLTGSESDGRISIQESLG